MNQEQNWWYILLDRIILAISWYHHLQVLDACVWIKPFTFKERGNKTQCTNWLQRLLFRLKTKILQLRTRILSRETLFYCRMEILFFFQCWVAGIPGTSLPSGHHSMWRTQQSIHFTCSIFFSYSVQLWVKSCFLPFLKFNSLCELKDDKAYFSCS